jgi:hypothetical protein
MPIFIPKGEKEMSDKATAHAFLKARLHRDTRAMRKLYGFDYDAPTCPKCDGILGKMSEPSKLICLRCGIEYELKRC